MSHEMSKSDSYLWLVVMNGTIAEDKVPDASHCKKSRKYEGSQAEMLAHMLTIGH